MKSLLFSAVCMACSLIGFAQAPITNYTNTADVSFAVVTASSSIDHSASGGNLTWNFDTLSQVDTNSDTQSTPSGTEVSTYPGTTEVLTITLASNPATPSKLFLKDAANELSITGVTSAALNLNYLNDNATIGTFPLNFGYNNSDNVAGNYLYDDGTNVYAGTFSGTIDTTVDAHGTLNMNDLGSGAFNGAVTRLRTEQNLSLDYSILTDVGTAQQISYFYYDNATGKLVFRSTTTTISVALLGINETVTVSESLLTNLLNTPEVALDSDISLYPNPVESELYLSNNSAAKMTHIDIMDCNGRRMRSQPYVTNTPITTEGLAPGLYFIKLHSASGTLTKKIIKR